MGQAGIHILNKVGYSMFWNSMWDNKISYSINLTEDLFLNKIFKYFLNDNVSFKFLKTKKLKTKKYFLKINKKTNNFFLKINFIEMYNSKLWVLKFQKWIILYNFIYIPNFNSLIKNNIKNKIKFNNLNFLKIYNIHKTFFFTQPYKKKKTEYFF